MSGSPRYLEFQKHPTVGRDHHQDPGEGTELAMDRARQGPSPFEYRRLRADLERFFTRLGKAYSPGN